MDHRLATAIKAPERYLLDEMTEDQRLDFEAHYFACDECAEEVRNGEILACGVKQVGGEFPIRVENRDVLRNLQRFWNWLSPAVLMPSAAAMALAILAGYQSFVLIPGLRSMVDPQAVQSVVLRAAARGEEPVIKLDPGSRVTMLKLDVNAGAPGEAITWQLQSPEGRTSFVGNAKIPSAGTPLELLVPNSDLHVGAWTLVLQTVQKEPVGRYGFQINQEKASQ